MSTDHLAYLIGEDEVSVINLIIFLVMLSLVCNELRNLQII